MERGGELAEQAGGFGGAEGSVEGAPDRGLELGRGERAISAEEVDVGARAEAAEVDGAPEGGLGGAQRGVDLVDGGEVGGLARREGLVDGDEAQGGEVGELGDGERAIGGGARSGGGRGRGRGRGRCRWGQGQVGDGAPELVVVLVDRPVDAIFVGVEGGADGGVEGAELLALGLELLPRGGRAAAHMRSAPTRIQ